MSFPTFSSLKCGNCGFVNKFMDWASTNSFGSPDLDMRPAEDYRFSLNQILVKRCSNCGYCNSDIRRTSDNTELIVNSQKYKDQLENNQFPEKANEFLCKSIILESNYEIEEAAWASLHAAWNCDDKDKIVQSKYCRNRAIELFQIGVITSTLKFEKKGEYPALLIDMLRKIEQFDKAMTICKIRLQKEEDDLIKKILYFQIQLIELQDVRTYKIDEAIEYYEKNIIEENRVGFYDENYNVPDDQENDLERDYFDAMTDGQMGDYDDFNGDIDEVDTWARG